jgi:hypothetical protein
MCKFFCASFCARLFVLGYFHVQVLMLCSSSNLEGFAAHFSSAESLATMIVYLLACSTYNEHRIGYPMRCYIASHKYTTGGFEAHFSTPHRTAEIQWPQRSADPSLAVQPDTRSRMHSSKMAGSHACVSTQVGDLTECANYGGLTLLPASIKLFSNLLLQRISTHIELNDHQCGFQHGHGTADALFALDATTRPCVQQGELTCLFFLDWSKSYDRVMHEAFLAHLAHTGVSGKLWQLVDALFTSAALPKGASTAANLCPWLCVVG